MSKSRKTKAQLVTEIEALRARLAAYESDAGTDDPVPETASRTQRHVGQELGELEGLYDTAPVGLCLVDADLRFVRVNNQLATASGVAPADHVGRTIREVIPAIADELEPVYRQVLDSGQPAFNVTIHGLLPAESAAERYWLGNFLPVRYADGTVRAVSTIVLEVTDRRLTDERVRLLSTAVEQSVEGVAVSDLEGRLIFINNAFASMHGYSTNELLGQNLSVFHTDEQMAAVNEANRKIDETGEFAGELWHARRNGSVFPMLMHNAVVRDEAGNAIAMLGTGRDITDRKRADEQRRRVEAQLRQTDKLRAIGQLAAGVAHDFNSLLMVILGNVELLERKYKGETGRGESTDAAAWEPILSAIERGRALVHGLLVFGRVQKSTPQIIDLNIVIAETRAMLQGLLDKHISVKTGLSSEVRRIRADAGQIGQAIMNLLVNARDAMPDGGTVTIETANATLDEADVAAHADARPGDYVMIAVSDTGLGMTEEARQRAFDPFFSTKPADKGTGMGLAIVHGIVKHAGGHIEVASELGKGAAFRLYFPAVE